jgi:carboxylesterase type B
MKWLTLLVVVAACGEDMGPPTIHVINGATTQSIYVYWYDSAGGPLLWNDGFAPGSGACHIPEIGSAFLSVEDAASIRLETPVEVQIGQHWVIRAADGTGGRATVTLSRGEAC